MGFKKFRSVLGKIKAKAACQIDSVLCNIFGSRHECNICGHKSNKFLGDGWHEGNICPRCRSDIRHRLIFSAFNTLDDFKRDHLIVDKDVLHFAPEKVIAETIKDVARSYQTADLLTEGYIYDNIDHNIDISNMPMVKNFSFDFVIACDVLEHVPDHIAGIKEVYRVLRKGGYCLFTVPQRDNMQTTYEDPAITSPEGREDAYGQFDHLRIYGEDFKNLMEDCSFTVSVIDANCFPEDVVKRNVLFPPVLSTRKNATNYRKIYIGRK